MQGPKIKQKERLHIETSSIILTIKHFYSKRAASRHGICYEQLGNIPSRNQVRTKMPAATWDRMGWWGHAVAYRNIEFLIVFPGFS